MGNVTILILIDGFLQYKKIVVFIRHGNGHNPYFNRWFSAIYDAFKRRRDKIVTILILIDGFLQYASDKRTTFAHESQSLF